MLALRVGGWDELAERQLINGWRILLLLIHLFRRLVRLRQLSKASLIKLLRPTRMEVWGFTWQVMRRWLGLMGHLSTTSMMAQVLLCSRGELRSIPADSMQIMICRRTCCHPFSRLRPVG